MRKLRRWSFISSTVLSLGLCVITGFAWRTSYSGIGKFFRAGCFRDFGVSSEAGRITLLRVPLAPPQSAPALPPEAEECFTHVDNRDAEFGGVFKGMSQDQADAGAGLRVIFGYARYIDDPRGFYLDKPRPVYAKSMDRDLQDQITKSSVLRTKADRLLIPALDDPNGWIEAHVWLVFLHDAPSVTYVNGEADYLWTPDPPFIPRDGDKDPKRRTMIHGAFYGLHATFEPRPGIRLFEPPFGTMHRCDVHPDPGEFENIRALWHRRLDTVVARVQWRMAFACVIAVTLAQMTYLTRQALGRRAARREGRCLECGYDLRASRQRCPECGTLLEPTHARTF